MKNQFAKHPKSESLDRLKRWPSLKARFEKVRIYSCEHQAYWRDTGQGYTTDSSESDILTMEEAFTKTCHCGPEKMIIFINAKSALEKTKMNKKELIEKIIAKQYSKETVDDRMYNFGIREAARLVKESEMSEAPTWFSTADEIYPQQIGNKLRETIPCLVIYKGAILLRFWNFHYTCWDSEDGDDFFCNRDQVSHWMPAPDKPDQKEKTQAVLDKSITPIEELANYLEGKQFSCTFGYPGGNPKADINDHATSLLNLLKASESPDTIDMTERLSNGEET